MRNLARCLVGTWLPSRRESQRDPTRRREPSPLWVSLAVAVGAVLVSTPARADDVATCVKASEQAQSLRDEGKYRKAREQLLVCTRDVCPSVVRKDCVQWLSEVDASMPSIVITARDGSGRDLTDVKVTLDGAALTEHLDGKPIPIDPGEHTLHYETAGAPPVDEKVVMHAGEKNRALSVQLGAHAQSASTSAGGGEGEQPRASKGPPVAAFIIGGLGVVALGSFAFFGLSGKSDVDDMRQPGGCAPNCSQSQVDSARTKLVIADISLGVGVVALGVATYMILANRSPASATVTTGTTRGSFLSNASFDVRAAPGGGVAQLGGRF